MRLCLLGATGNSGRRVLSLALARGHQVTALVRRPGALAEAPNLTSQILDYENDEALCAALADHDVIINCAGYVTEGERFTSLVGRIIKAADKAQGPRGRFWLFGGAALLNVPGSNLIGLDLPGVPKFYEAHQTNYNAVRATHLDWSMLCPGPMIDAPDGQGTPGLIVSADQWPLPRPAFSRFLPRVATSLAFKQRLPELTIYYEDAAKIILDHLERNGRFARKRVGVALPKGERRFKATR
ncbi:NAD(P)-dependent oxidoreductase [Candidatus Viadribacter manganicus]|nr:NAD(P)H-binding protein [Candidatus Viadribacter manganicus]